MSEQSPPLQTSNPVVVGYRTTDVDALRAAFAERATAASVEPGRPLAIALPGPAEALGAAAWCLETGADALLTDEESMTPALRERLLATGFVVLSGARVHEPATAARKTRPGRITLLTSGTTGEPKLVAHDWTSLFTMGRVAEHARTWLLTYRPGTYAWFQLATLGLFVPGQTLVVPEATDPAGQLREAAAAAVTAISATPSFWRVALLLGRDVPDGLDLEQISLGGEPVDQPILDALAARFPRARVTHIYASTEAGACIVVHDGRAGFPETWLDTAVADDDTRPRLRLHDGRLWVRSPTASPGASGEIDTGDAAEVRDGRVFVLGRVGSAFLNVGGAKVRPFDVQLALLAHPAVLWCRVRGHEARLVGTLVAADVVFAPGATQPSEAELARFAAERLPPAAVPRFFEVLDSIPLGDNLKTELP